MSQKPYGFASQFVTKANQELIGKPNEDYVICDDKNGIYIVCDGVTRSTIRGSYPIPSPASEVSELFAVTVYNELIKHCLDGNSEKVLREAIELGNFAIAQYNQEKFEYIDYLEKDLAGTVAIVALLNNSKLFYCYIGDCYGYLFCDGHMTQFTESQTRRIEEYRQKSKASMEEQILTIRKTFRNNISEYYGYGVFTGEASALDFVKYGELMVSDRCSVIMTSDGLLPLMKSNFQFSPNMSPNNLVVEAEHIERKLNIRSDDKTVVILNSKLLSN